MPELKKKATHGLKWSAIERILTQGMQFVMMIVIARQLSPDDFGLVGMLAIFMAISQTFIDSGFSSALIRKGEPSELECSTAFYFNVVIGLVCYGLLFFASPYIAGFYNESILSDLTKVIGLNVVFSSLAVVQRAKLTIALDFKKQSIVSLLAVIISGSIGITMAYKGLGVWSLVTQTVSMNGLLAVLLWVFVGWKPEEKFCFITFKELFGFGSKLLASSLIDTVYRNIHQIIIGRQFSAAQLGYFTQAKQFSEMPAVNISTIIERVNFPLMSKVKDDNEQLQKSYNDTLKYISIFFFPLMGGLAVVSEQLVVVVLGEQWVNVASLLTILCFRYVLTPVHIINLNLLKVKGRSDLFLKLEVVKKIITTLILFITVPYGVEAMCFGIVVDSFIAFFINCHYTEKLIKLSVVKQLKVFAPAIFMSFVALFVGYLTSLYLESGFNQLAATVLVSVVIYLLLMRVFLKKELSSVLSFFK